MKIIKKLNNEKNTILIYKKKNKYYVDKIFNPKNLVFYKKEVLGLKYFIKKKYFEIPKLYYYKIKNNSGIITQEYINGKKASIFDIKTIFKKISLANNKSSIKNYIIKLNKNYCHKKKYLPKKLKNNYFLQKKKIFVSKTHGDFVNYNCLRKGKKSYILDFEKFRERIAVYDYLNWIFHPLSYNISKYFFSSRKIFIFKFLNISIVFVFNYLIKVFARKIFYKLKINIKDFDIYYYLYLYEKILIIKNDLAYVKNKKLKFTTKKYIQFLNFIIFYFSRKMNNKIYDNYYDF